MSKIKILIVEDEAIIAEDMARKLITSGYEITACVDNSREAIRSVKDNPPDLIFMDIAIAGKDDGIETARQLKAIDNFPVIFLTNLHDEKTLKRLKPLKPAGYLPKPFAETQLHASIQYALYNLAEPENTTPQAADTFFIKDSNGTFQKYHISEILYIEADGAYCNIFLENGHMLVQTKNMRDMTERINHPNLERTHRSYTVNIDKIEAMKGNILIVNNQEIPLSADYKDSVLNRLKMVR